MSANIIHIGFLTAAKVTFNPLTWVSKAIEKLSGKYTHAFCLFEKDNTIYVRSMEAFGSDVSKTYKEYSKSVIDRMELLWLDVIDSSEYNEYCLKTKSKYDYANLLLWQLIKSKIGYFFGWDTKYRRSCGEDVLRCIKIAIPNFPGRAESITPTELYELIVKYNSLLYD